MASMNEVAKRAGVSIATVSRVLNNSESVNEETRMKILKAIKELKYQPSRVAKRLRSKSGAGNLLGVLIPDIQNPFYVDVLRGIEDVAYQNNYVIIMCNFSQDEKKEAMYLEILESEAIDGLIAAPAHEEDQRVKKIVRNGLPVVCVDRGLKGMDVDVVWVNNQESAYQAVSFMIEKGYKRIAHIGGLPTIPSSRLRLEGYRNAMQDHGLDLDENLIIQGDSSYASGMQVTEKLLSMTNPPDALFTGNNLITLGALEVINGRKLQIPKDIAVLGFDDMNWSNALNPPLTAVRQPAYEIGKRAGELLIQRIKDPKRPCIQMTLNSELKIRHSC
ncbi:LacI family DNA-binding transcriptional regulator [Mangrovibacterium marinum]|uniref:LacI family transcriptional regulator n=1 Tax=Mangrovibacterium marinum TaxID=1639118 RepID=A0A2T5C401_9BACT|nr:LacI family DNA-binding transcriptional regulator [Mangrovibacterium marinum]PTN09537.1 LacI family transcriptional regulator [Mangrovibacterium marinum]